MWPLQDVVRELLKSKLANPRNKITEATVEVVTELARIMVIEASARACYQAQTEDKHQVSLDHVEAILAQMVSGAFAVYCPRSTDSCVHF